MKRFSKPRQPDPGMSAQQELFGLYIQRRDILTSVGELYLKAEQRTEAWVTFAIAAEAGKNAATLLNSAIKERLDKEKERLEKERLEQEKNKE
jgi:hypothetical protein